MFVKGTHEEKEEEILNQDSIEVNVLKVNEADSMAEKSTQDDKEKSAVGGFEDEFITKDEDEFNVFNGKKKTLFDFKMFDIPKVDDKEKSAVDEDIKPDIKDASIRVQPKRECSIAWYLKSHFKVRGSALNNYAHTLSQTEVLTVDTLFIMDEETDLMGSALSNYAHTLSQTEVLTVDTLFIMDEETDLMSKFAARILLFENNSYKDEFLKKVDKVRLIDKNTRRELIDKAVLRRPAKLDEYFGIMKS
nr:hypothetical protein [Tanacetum cinerariifolium]